MPEGDTVFAAAARLREALVGKTLTRCDIRVPQYATVDLTGETVEEVLSRGKHLFIRVGAASIHSHLKMDGSWLVGTVRVPSHKVRIILETDTSRASGVDLGVLEVLDRADDLDAVAHLGPDLLGADWSAELAANNLMTDPARPMAEALLDQRLMAGVGNVYANELCFVFGLRPLTPVGSLDNPLRVVTRHKKCCGPTGYGGIAPSPAIPDGVPNSGCTAGPASRAGAAARPFRPTKPVTGCATGVRRVKNEACSQLRTTAIFRPSAC